MTPQEESQHIAQALERFGPKAQARLIAHHLMEIQGWPYALSATQNRIRIARLCQASLQAQTGPAPVAQAEPMPVAPLEELLKDRQLRKLGESEKFARKQYQTAIGQIELLSSALDVALSLRETTPVQALILDEGTPGEALPIVQWSDWHVEERVEPATINGLNEYNPDIAKRRAFKLAQNTLRLIQKERKDNRVEEMILSLGGDFVNNFLHEWDVRQNYMSPIEALRYAKELLITNIDFLVKYGDFKRLVIICVRGNHGRQTPKMSSSDDYRMNYEQMLYLDLKAHFERVGAPIEWVIPQGGFGYVTAMGKTIRVFHGWEVKSMGGVGGVTIPLYKALHRWNQTIRTDFNLMHDKHTLYRATPDCQINGSLVGFNSYAQTCGFRYEPPLQAMNMLYKKHGFTASLAIVCE